MRHDFYQPHRRSAPGRSSQSQTLQEDRQRLHMVTQLQGWNIRDCRILTAMMATPRDRFVPTRDRNWAYEDRPLPLPYGQTVTQPHVVAYMLEQADIRSDHHVLEIGTGYGYQSALLAQLAEQVYSLEIIPKFAERAHQTLGELGYGNVHIKVGNGFDGLVSHGPYDRILVCGAAPEIPPALLDQLAVDGKLVMPVGRDQQQTLQVMTKTVIGQTLTTTIAAAFEPLLAHCPVAACHRGRFSLRR